MTSTKAGLKMRRRQFLQTTAAITAGYTLPSPSLAQVCLPKAGTVGDRLWIFCNPANADYDVLRRRSVMTPFEAAVYLGVPNIIMVQQYPQPGQEAWFKPWEPPFEQYAVPLRLLKRVVWSIVGAAGVTKVGERKEVLAMARHTPNFVGVFMDDFFREEGEAGVASFTPDELRDIQQQLKGPDKKLDLYVTLYAGALDRPIADYLKLIDVITLWTSRPADLVNLDTNLTRLEKLAPRSRKMLGLYTVDYDEKRNPQWIGMPVPIMQQQCEQALRCLHAGRIEGIIIYGGTTLDLNFEAADWTRDWIQKVGEIKL